MNDFTLLGSCIAILSVLYVIYRRLNPFPPPGPDNTEAFAAGLSFPPGPRGNPILGQLNTDIYDLALLDEWRKKYGDIVSVNILGTRNVILYTQELVTEFFERRSNIYSDRHPQPMFQLIGWYYNIALMRYGEWWRRHRKGFHQYFNQNAVKKFAPVQETAVHTLLNRLYKTPDEFADHMEHYAAHIIMKIVYDYDLKPKNDNFIKLVQVALEGAGEALVIGNFLVDYIPWLEYVPGWFPGAGWKRKANKWKEATLALNQVPFDMVKENMARGEAGPSVTASGLTHLSLKAKPLPDDEDVVRNISGIMYAAGAGTTLSGLMTLILAIVLHPEAQKKAQKEIDSIIKDRLPTLEDREVLPYVNAFVNESQRWKPVIPLAVAHYSFKDDVYDGYFIPKGSVVTGNALTILHDEKLYGPNVESFIPERFLKPGISSPTAQWGYGRRICPGRYLASGNLFLAAANVLKVFDVIPATDENRNPIPISQEYVGKAILGPAPFKCAFKPRSEVTKRLILE